MQGAMPVQTVDRKCWEQCLDHPYQHVDYYQILRDSGQIESTCVKCTHNF